MAIQKMTMNLQQPYTAPREDYDLHRKGKVGAMRDLKSFPSFSLLYITTNVKGATPSSLKDGRNSMVAKV